ncbi:pyridoxamine 5'-phosphate oxidase family protein [Actinotalea solisilvae]|uniref:pyridoxamine 5'-phosphate oxidase family protein n=1 Tax=Actinotalea solisilvae TaxID=2072922 RepID=UPI0018F20BA3|nr:pyridoxamine 5'-phosphate oxidase family protein [Actinotalea solisilvae]
MTTTDDGARRVAALLADERTAMLTTTAPDGTLMSRPMALQEVEPDGDLWFFAQRSSRTVAHLAAHPQVNVTVSSASTWVSLTGTARVVTDDARKRELWSTVVEAWFPDGPDDPEVVLLEVEGDSAEYWDTPGGRVASLVSFVKAKATGQPYDGGENERVEL